MFQWIKRRKTRRQEVRTFVNIVQTVYEGIHQLDELLSKTNAKRDYSYHATTLVERSVSDLINLCAVYRAHRLFHAYNLPAIDRSIKALVELVGMMDENSKCIDYLITDMQNIGRLEEACGVTEHSRIKMVELQTAVAQHGQKMNYAITNIRGILVNIRSIVSEDRIKIITGVDLERAFQQDEAVARQNLKMVIHFDRAEIRKFSLKSKEVITDEH